MYNAITLILGNSLKMLLTEKLIIGVIIILCEYLVKKTTNNLDNDLLAKIKIALGQ